MTVVGCSFAILERLYCSKGFNSYIIVISLLPFRKHTPASELFPFYLLKNTLPHQSCFPSYKKKGKNPCKLTGKWMNFTLVHSHMETPTFVLILLFQFAFSVCQDFAFPGKSAKRDNCRTHFWLQESHVKEMQPADCLLKNIVSLVPLYIYSSVCTYCVIMVWWIAERPL